VVQKSVGWGNEWETARFGSRFGLTVGRLSALPQAASGWQTPDEPWRSQAANQ
jgi:hypothetical protein